jgi:NitT/TauT family transport system substrate-binding protein
MRKAYPFVFQQMSGTRLYRDATTGWRALVLVLIGALVILTGCAHDHGQRPIVKINILTWPGYGPIYVAQAKGFFDQEGVQVDCTIQEDTQARQAALVGGQIDLVGITLESVILANAQGIPMQVTDITDISNGGDGIVAKSGIDSIAQLKGKRIAFPEGQPSHLFLLYELDKAGLSSADITPVYTDDAGKAGEIFAAGQADAAVTWEPWLSRVSESGKGHILLTSKGVKDILIGILAADRNRVPANLDKLQRFARGYYRGLDYVQTHLDDAVPIMAQAFKMPPDEFRSILGGLRFISKDDAKQLTGATNPPGGFYQISKYEESLWRKAGIIKTPIDVRQVYTGSVLAGVR